MKICFVNPPKNRAELFKDMRHMDSLDTTAPPWGLLHLAAVTRELGHETSLLDSLSLKLSHEETVRRILDFKPDLLGLTAVTVTVNSAAKVARMVKEVDPNIKIVLGGVHLTTLPEETMNSFPEFDVGVVGEGEDTVAELSSLLKPEKDLSHVKGLIIRKNGGVTRTEARPPIQDLDKLPMPAFDLLPSITEIYKPKMLSVYQEPSITFLSTRGCPGQCAFCDTKVFGSKCRAFSAEYVIKMIHLLKDRYGIRDLQMQDDVFLVFPKRAKELCKELKRLGITWSCYSRVNLVNPDILKILRESGCWQIEYGIETGSKRILKQMRKGTTLEQTEKALRMTKDAGMSTMGTIILGYPTEDRQSLEETIAFVKKIDLDLVFHTFLTPFPGSAVYQTADKYGKFNKDWDQMSCPTINFIPDGFTKEELIEYSKRFYREFYLRPKIVLVYLKLALANPHFFWKLFTGFKSFVMIAFFRNTHVEEADERSPDVSTKAA